MPCLLLQNIPSNTTADSLHTAFADSGAKAVNIIGGTTFQMAVPNSAEALKAANVINSMQINGVKLMVRKNK